MNIDKASSTLGGGSSSARKRRVHSNEPPASSRPPAVDRKKLRLVGRIIFSNPLVGQSCGDYFDFMDVLAELLGNKRYVQQQIIQNFVERRRIGQFVKLTAFFNVLSDPIVESLRWPLEC